MVLPAVPTFTAPRRWHPGYALLGRWLRRRHDARRAEALQLVVLTTAALALVLSSSLAWALWHPAFAAAPGGPAIAAFWAAQAGGALLLALVGLVGWQPPLTVTAGPAALTLRQGRRRLHLPYAFIEHVAPLDPLRYHRHYARYAATRPYVYHPAGPLLLLGTARGPVVVGLPPAALDALAAHLATRRAAVLAA